MSDLLGLGSLVGGVLGYFGQEETNDTNLEIMHANNAFNAQQAQVNREWSAEQAAKANEFTKGMASSQWRRAVTDMKRAGLNPMLAYSQGGNASGSGAMGQSSAASAAHAPQMVNSIGAGVSSALEGARTISDVMTQDQQRKIKSPFEKLADVASQWIDEFGKFVRSVGEQNRVVVTALTDRIEKLDVRALPATVAAKVADVLESGLDDVKRTVRGKISGTADSARQGVDRVGEAIRDTARRVDEALGEAIHGKGGVSPPPSKGKVPLDAQRRRGSPPTYHWDVR